MHNKKQIILIILSVAAVFSLIYGITTPPARKGLPHADLQRGVGGGESRIMTKRIIPTSRRAKKTDFVFYGRNPFAPKKTSAEMTTKLILNGIVRDDIRPKAIINDEIVEAGGKVGKYTIVRITRNSVVLNDGMNDFELTLGE